jgi:hypothetical protein
MNTRHINPLLWQQSLDYARQTCARIFRDGGTPAQAMRAFGLNPQTANPDWGKAVDAIAQSLSTAPARKAA